MRGPETGIKKKGENHLTPSRIRPEIRREIKWHCSRHYDKIKKKKNNVIFMIKNFISGQWKCKKICIIDCKKVVDKNATQRIL